MNTIEQYRKTLVSYLDSLEDQDVIAKSQHEEYQLQSRFFNFCEEHQKYIKKRYHEFDCDMTTARNAARKALKKKHNGFLYKIDNEYLETMVSEWSCKPSELSEACIKYVMMTVEPDASYKNVPLEVMRKCLPILIDTTHVLNSRDWITMTIKVHNKTELYKRHQYKVDEVKALIKDLDTIHEAKSINVEGITVCVPLELCKSLARIEELITEESLV